MARPRPPQPLAAPRDRGALRALAESALSRAAGGAVTTGNGVRVLRNASENYPAWLAAIGAARERVLFENYLFADDATGRRFAGALADAARRGVRVRLLRDWMGCLGVAGRGLWRDLEAAGVEVRTFNPPRLDLPLGWLSRDHRKSLAVDGRVAFVSGLCVSDRWTADPRRGTGEWRDTGVELLGPAVEDVEEAFAAAWEASGGHLPEAELCPPPEPEVAPPGEVAVRVVATAPSEAGLFRLDLLVAAVARQRLWLTDAYFLAGSTYVEALRAASRDGVDVRLLVPGESDLPFLSPFSRAGYRPLLEAGVRVYEWQGAMLHAKTAVADGHWARVGSSNLNLSSWLGNYELDVTVEDDRVAGELERIYREDLEGATEVVLSARKPRLLRNFRLRPSAGSASPAAAGALRVGHAVGAALTAQRALGPAEARPTAAAGAVLLVLAALAALWPRLLAVPLAVLGLWLGSALLYRAWRLAHPSRVRRRARQLRRRRRRRERRREERQPTAHPPA